MKKLLDVPGKLLFTLTILLLTIAGEVYSQVPARDVSLYKPNYFMFISGMNGDVGENSGKVKFQYSSMTNIVHTKWVMLFVGYTQKSFWKLYQEDSPFSEHNFNPELFLQWYNIGQVSRLQAGIEHESTGVSGIFSRSWNRAYIEGKFEKIFRRVTLSGYLKLWGIFQKDENNNPDIADFLGYGHAIVALQRTNGVSRLALEVRRKSVLIDLYGIRAPKWQNFYFYVQVWHGYGESLVNYNRKSTRASFGIALVKK